MFRKILLSILFIILITGTIIGLHAMFNGAITEWSKDINSLGFFKSVGKFFKEIWYGFRDTVGF